MVNQLSQWLFMLVSIAELEGPSVRMISDDSAPAKIRSRADTPSTQRDFVRWRTQEFIRGVG
jgi:hypothetical protein